MFESVISFLVLKGLLNYPFVEENIHPRGSKGNAPSWFVVTLWCYIVRPWIRMSFHLKGSSHPFWCLLGLPLIVHFLGVVLGPIFQVTRENKAQIQFSSIQVSIYYGICCHYIWMYFSFYFMIETVMLSFGLHRKLLTSLRRPWFVICTQFPSMWNLSTYSKSLDTIIDGNWVNIGVIDNQWVSVLNI